MKKERTERQITLDMGLKARYLSLSATCNTSFINVLGKLEMGTWLDFAEMELWIEKCVISCQLAIKSGSLI